jgi:queuosine precursor transporter
MSIHGRLALAAAFLSCIPIANWLIGSVGTVCVPNGPCLIPITPPIGSMPAMMAPTGVVMIGVGLALRDLLQEAAGRAWVVTCIGLGAAVSLMVAPAAVSMASTTAFLLAELADWGVYDRLRRRGMALAVLASGAVGAVVDSLLFSYLAFGEVKWAAGFILAKLYASVAFAVWLWWRGKRRAARAERQVA